MSQKPRPRPSSQSSSTRARPADHKCMPSEPKKAVPDGYVDPAAGIVFPERRRRLR